MTSEMWVSAAVGFRTLRFQNGDLESFPMFLPLDTCCDPGKDQILTTTDAPPL